MTKGGAKLQSIKKKFTPSAKLDPVSHTLKKGGRWFSRDWQLYLLLLPAVIYVIISFLLDGIISNIIPFNLVDPSYFKTIYSVISLVIIYNYFDNHQKYLKILITLGIFFDIVYILSHVIQSEAKDNMTSINQSISPIFKK